MVDLAVAEASPVIPYHVIYNILTNILYNQIGQNIDLTKTTRRSKKMKILKLEKESMLDDMLEVVMLVIRRRRDTGIQFWPQCCRRRGQ